MMTDETTLTMYTTPWCGDCHRSKSFLKRHGVPFREINIEHDPDGAKLVMQVNGGYQSVPTLVFSDGTTMSEPSNRELAEKLGLAAVGSAR